MERKSKAEALGAPVPFAGGRERRSRSERGRLIDAAVSSGQSQHERPAPTLFNVKDLAYNPFNPRGQRTDVQETADSLLQRGQIQPVTVVTREAFLNAHSGTEALIGDAPYVVLDGNIRLESAKLAGLEQLRGDLNDELATTAEDMLESALVANIRRSAMSPLDEAKVLKVMVERHGSARAVSRIAGKTHTWVNQRVALLNLTPELQAELERGELAIEDARKVAGLPGEEQRAALDQAAQARETRNIQRRIGGSDSATQPAKATAQQMQTAPESGSAVSTEAPSSRPTSEAPAASSSNGGGNGASTVESAETRSRVPEPRPSSGLGAFDGDAQGSNEVEGAGASSSAPAAEGSPPSELLRGNGASTKKPLNPVEERDIHALAEQLLQQLSKEQLQMLMKLLASEHVS